MPTLAEDLLRPPLPAGGARPKRRRTPRRTHRRWMLPVAGFLLALVVLIFGIGPRLGTFLLVSDEPAPADATFLTYAVNIRKLALDQAVERYRRGEGPHVLIGALHSRDAEYYITPHSSEMARRYVVDAGVDPAAVEVLPSVTSENEEGQRLRDAIAGHGWRRVVAYTPDFRARRTMGTLKRAVASTGVELRVVAIPDVETRLDRWWETRPGVNTIYNEYPRLVYYFLRGRL